MSTRLRTQLLEYTLWLLSRTILVVAVAVLALLLRLPFERLLSRDLDLEVERMERARILVEYRTASELVLAVEKFHPLFSDAISAIVAFEKTPIERARSVAKERLLDAREEFEHVRAIFRNRPVSLDDKLEHSIVLMLGDVEQTFLTANSIVDEPAILRTGSVSISFDASLALLEHDMTEIEHQERIAIQRQNALR